jgi:nucleotide-binding universal stress UspA family protein
MIARVFVFVFVCVQISGRVRSDCGSKPGEIICRVAEEEDVAMIVVGTRGLGKVRRAIMGSVSDYVVHHAPCPVIVCRQ